MVREPRVTRRTMPLAVEFPAYYRHEIVVRGALLYPTEDKSFHDDALDFTRRSETHEDLTSLVFELRAKRDFVPVESVAEHVAVLTQIRESVSPTLGVREPPKSQRETNLQTAWGLGIFGGLAVAILVGTKVVPAVRRRRWARRVRARAGETAALAQVVPTRDAAERALVAARCECGGAFGLEPGSWTALAYAGEEVTAGRARCGSCGERRVRYFAGSLSD